MHQGWFLLSPLLMAPGSPLPSHMCGNSTTPTGPQLPGAPREPPTHPCPGLSPLLRPAARWIPSPGSCRVGAAGSCGCCTQWGYLGAGLQPIQPLFPPKGPGASSCPSPGCCLSGNQKGVAFPTLSSFSPFSLSVSLLVSFSFPSLLSSISFQQASLFLSHHIPFLLCLLVLSKARSVNSLLTNHSTSNDWPGPQALGTDREPWSIAVGIPQP